MNFLPCVVLQTARKKGVSRRRGKKKGFYSRVTPRSNFSARQSDYVLRRVPTTPANRAFTFSSYRRLSIMSFFCPSKKNWRSKYVGARAAGGIPGARNNRAVEKARYARRARDAHRRVFRNSVGVVWFRNGNQLFANAHLSLSPPSLSHSFFFSSLPLCGRVYKIRHAVCSVAFTRCSDKAALCLNGATSRPRSDAAEIHFPVTAITTPHINFGILVSCARPKFDARNGFEAVHARMRPSLRHKLAWLIAVSWGITVWPKVCTCVTRSFGTNRTR